MIECLISVTPGADWPAGTQISLGAYGEVTIDTSSLNPAHVGNFNLQLNFELIDKNLSSRIVRQTESLQVTIA